MNKELAIIYHFGSGEADFQIRANGDFEWNGPGPEPTDEDMEQWDSERLDGLALEDQKQACIQLLDDSEKAVSNDPPYPDDIEAWKTFRAGIRTILKSNSISTIPAKPF